MKKVMNIVISIILIIWQLPQFIVGVILASIYSKGSHELPRRRVHCRVYACSIKGGICLGNIILINKYQCTNDTIQHEFGHYIQSLYLGWLYLIIIGIPSITWAAIHNIVAPNRSYYDFYTESWADELGGVNRN